MVHLNVDRLTSDEARRLSDLSVSRGTYPLEWRPAREHRRLLPGREPRTSGPTIWIRDEFTSSHELFTDTPRAGTPYLGVNPLLAPQLAALFVLLGEELPGGFQFQAGWGDDRSGRELVLSGRELAALAFSSQIEEDLLYVVGSGSWRAGSLTSRPLAEPAAGEPSSLPACEFATPGPLRDQLVAAVMAREKTATSSLLAEYHDETLPVVGQRLGVVDSRGSVVAVVELTEVRILRLHEIDDSFARDEGEGFATVTDWRKAHEEFWATDPYVAELGIELSHLTLVVACRFQLVGAG